MKKNAYLSTALSIYTYFVVFGMAVISMSQSSAHLQEQWGATPGNVLMAISGIGIGKVIGPSFAGFMSDRIGRRRVVLTSFGLYLVFLLGILVSPSWQVGFVLAVVFGLANSVGDTGNYPTLMEAFPRTAGSASILVKAAIAAGQFLLPLIITALAALGAYWGTAFLGLAAVLVVLFLAHLRLPYPDYRSLAAEQAARLVETGDGCRRVGARVGVEGVAMVLYGFCATGMFWLAQNSLPGIGVSLAGMSDAAGRGLVSVYSIGSLIGVFVTAALVARKLAPVVFLLLNPIVSALAYLGLLLVPDATAYQVFAFLIGYFAAGGLFQLTVVVLAEFFPARKGVVTSMIGLASGLAAFGLPYLSGVLVGDASDPITSYRRVVLVGLVVAVSSALLGALVMVRHRTIFPRRPGGHDGGPGEALAIAEELAVGEPGSGSGPTVPAAVH